MTKVYWHWQNRSS